MEVATLLVGQVVCFLSIFSLFLLLGKQVLYRVNLFILFCGKAFGCKALCFKCYDKKTCSTSRVCKEE